MRDAVDGLHEMEDKEKVVVVIADKRRKSQHSFGWTMKQNYS